MTPREREMAEALAEKIVESGSEDEWVAVSWCIEALREIGAFGVWRPIDDEAKSGDLILGVWEDFPPEAVRWDEEDGQWEDDYGEEYLEPTHYMPLPEPPETD